MDYEVKYGRIKHGYVRLGNNGNLKLSIPIKLKNNKDFELKLLEKGKLLLKKYKTRKYIEGIGNDYLIIFGEKILNSSICNLDKKDQNKVLKDFLYEKSIPILDKYSNLLGKNYYSLKIKDLKSKRGSCSKDQKIILNLKLLHLPKDFLEYVIIHEVCHLQEKNHSKNFWKLVEEFLPKYKNIRKELKNFKL